jgi:hypothetical protein
MFLWGLTARAQDTLVVNWQNPDQSIKVNALRDAVLGDTTSGGARANLNRVYRLKKGGYYAITDRIENGSKGGWALRLVGETPDASNNPAVLQVYRRNDGTVDQRMITGQNDLEMKNLWVTGADDLGTQTAYQPVQIDASNHKFKFDNVIFDRSNFAIVAFTATGNVISFTNCKFRNLIGRPSTQQWEGRGVSVWADQDTVIIENCTFFNVEFTAFQMESGAAKYVRFNHNTMVNIGRNFLTGAWWREAYFANNLLINGFWMGEGVADYTASGRDPRAYNSGFMSIGPLPSIYGPEQGRRIVLANTATWRDPQFTTWYADTIRPQYYINRVTKEDELTQYPNMVAKDTLWLASRPNMPTYPDTLLPKMWANIIDLRRGITPATPYFFNLPQFGGSECFTCVDWPLPDNFSYTTPANILTAGTDHLPLGDLNWFPTQKAQFEANKAKYLDTLHAMAGPVTRFTPIMTVEAETGTLSGSSAVNTFTGFSYFQMDGGGYIEWKFNVPAAGQYDVAIWQNMRGNHQRGQHTFINGVEIHDESHQWGELIYDDAQGITTGMDINNWAWVKWTQAAIHEANSLTLPAGQNTIRISSSWGYQNFAGIDLYPAGTSTATVSLRAPDATDYSIVAPHGEGAPWVPSHFKSVKLGTNGTIVWSGLTFASTGTYTVQVFYQNYSGAQTGSIKLDAATVVPSLAFASKADSTGLNVLATPYFSVSAGTHSLTLSGTTANIDFIQVTQVVTAVTNNGGVPERFALEQNYPNPFNPTTKINFTVPKSARVTLTIFNVLGQKVATLVDGFMNTGSYTVDFNATNLATGVYFYRLEAGGLSAAKKMLLLK